MKEGERGRLSFGGCLFLAMLDAFDKKYTKPTVMVGFPPKEMIHNEMERISTCVSDGEVLVVDLETIKARKRVSKRRRIARDENGIGMIEQAR